MAACMRWEVMTAPHISQQWRNMTPRYTAVKFIIRKTRLLPGLPRLDAVDRVKRYKWICCVNMWQVLGLLIGWPEQHVDRHRQHVESTQQCRGGRARRHALRRRRQWWHQLPELSGALQPQDQHLGRSCRHEYTQVSHIYKENRGYGLFFFTLCCTVRGRKRRDEKKIWDEFKVIN